MNFDDIDIVKFIILRKLIRKRNRQKRKLWVNPLNTRKNTFDAFNDLFPDLLNNPEQFYHYFHMSKDSFFHLNNILNDEIAKQDTNYRRAIQSEQRLAIFLRYLVSGESFTAIGQIFRVGISTVHNIIKEVNEAVWKTLQPSYMPMPTAQTWIDISESFFETFKMPHCIGGIDGKRCLIKSPPHTTDSIVLMAIANIDCNFIMVDVNTYEHDGNKIIFNESALGKAITFNKLNIPGSQNIPNSDIRMDFYFVGDEAFPLRNNLMIPYAQRELDFSKEIFNKKLSETHRIVDCAFNILTKKFGIFQKPIVCNSELAEASIRSACVLHNYIRQKEKDCVLERQLLEENDLLNELPSLNPTLVHRESAEAIQSREILKNYIVSPAGSLVWQKDQTIEEYLVTKSFKDSIIS